MERGDRELEEYSTKGMQITCYMYGVKGVDIGMIEQHMVIATNLCGANILSSATAENQVILLLSESHFSFHRYGTNAFLDIFTCGERVTPMVAVKHMLDHLKPERFTWVMGERGVKGEPSNG